MKTSEMEKWKKTRSKGKKKFIIQNGVLGWGLTTGIFWSIIMNYTSESNSFPNFISLLIPALILFSIGGYFWGILVWNITEKKYQKTLKEKSNK